MYEIILEKKPENFFRKLERKEQERVAKKFNELEKNAKTKSIDHDISLSWEDYIEVYKTSILEWIYTMISIEWISEDFQSVLDKFKDSSPFIVSIRESENSPRFWNRVIKVDIVN